MWPLPEYITEFIGDENRLAVLREAQRSRPFWELPVVLLNSQYLVARWMRTGERTVGSGASAHPTPTL